MVDIVQIDVSDDNRDRLLLHIEHLKRDDNYQHVGINQENAKGVIFCKEFNKDEVVEHYDEYEEMQVKFENEEYSINSYSNEAQGYLFFFRQIFDDSFSKVGFQNNNVLAFTKTIKGDKHEFIFDLQVGDLMINRFGTPKADVIEDDEEEVVNIKLDQIYTISLYSSGGIEIVGKDINYRL